MSYRASPLWQIMHPRSIAWAGASNNPTRMGTIQLLSLMNTGFRGKVFPLHPTEDTVLQMKAYRSACDLPEVPDLAVLVVPTRVASAVLEDLGRGGVRRAVIVTAGFKEMGDEGRRLEQELNETAQRFGIRFVGPNCIGIINTRERLNTTFFPAARRRGRVAIASQSGTYVTQVQLYLSRLGIGLSQAISVGNEANIDVVDCMDYYAGDRHTGAVILYLETIRRPRRFLESARELTRHKPVLALYVGGTEAGARSGASHTGAMAGDDPLYDGLFQQAGVLRVSSVEELYTLGFVLASQPPLRGRRIGIVSHSGGPVTCIADACERRGLEVPVFSTSLQAQLAPYLPSTASGTNPVDLTFSIDIDAMATEIPRRLLESGEVDGVIVHGIMGSAYHKSHARKMKGVLGLKMREWAMKESKKLASLARMPAEFGKPVVCSSFMDRGQDNCTRYLQDHGIPVFDSPEKAVNAMFYLARYGQVVARGDGEAERLTAAAE